MPLVVLMPWQAAEPFLSYFNVSRRIGRDYRVHRFYYLSLHRQFNLYVFRQTTNMLTRISNFPNNLLSCVPFTYIPKKINLISVSDCRYLKQWDYERKVFWRTPKKGVIWCQETILRCKDFRQVPVVDLACLIQLRR